MKRLNKRVVAATTVGGLLVGGVALAVLSKLNLKETLFDSSSGQYGVGLVDQEDSDGTFYFDRYLGAPNPAFPALHAYTALPAPATAFRAEATAGISALIGDTVPDFESEFQPLFDVDDYPTLVIADDGPMNVPGAINDKEEVNRVAADIRGAIKLCGKSEVGDGECTNQAYLYLEDGSGNLVVKFGNGNGFVIASVASASFPF